MPQETFKQSILGANTLFNAFNQISRLMDIVMVLLFILKGETNLAETLMNFNFD